MQKDIMKLLGNVAEKHFPSRTEFRCDAVKVPSEDEPRGQEQALIKITAALCSAP